jgi:hypothetical protein
MQLEFTLQHVVQFTHSISNTDHPDRTGAELTANEICSRHGDDLVKVAIHKIKNRSGAPTWNVRYTIRVRRLEWL